MLSREESVLPIVGFQEDEQYEWEEELDIGEENDLEFDDEDEEYVDEYEEYEEEFSDDDEPRRERRHAEWE